MDGGVFKSMEYYRVFSLGRQNVPGIRIGMPVPFLDIGRIEPSSCDGLSMLLGGISLY